LHGCILAIPGGVPSLLAIVEVIGSSGGGVQPGLGVRGVGGIIREVSVIKYYKYEILLG
jgi:hypothetical protein